MKDVKILMLLLLVSNIFAEKIDIHGKIAYSNIMWKDTIPILTVTLKDNNISTATDSSGNFYLGGETGTITSLNNYASTLDIKSGKITLNTGKNEKVEISLYSLSGRELFHLSQVFSAGKHNINAFNQFMPSLSDAYYILKCKLGNQERVLKISTISSQTLFFNSPPITFKQRNRVAFDTLELTYNGQLVGNLPVNELVDTIPTIPIYKMVIDGAFLDTFDFDPEKGNHSIKATIYGLEFLSKDSFDLEYNTSNNSFKSDEIFLHIPDSINELGVRVFTKDKNGILGMSRVDKYHKFHSNINISSFNSKNSKASHGIGGEDRVFIGGTASLYRLYENPYFIPCHFTWDDTRTPGIDVDSTSNSRFEVSFTDTGKVEFISVLTDSSGNKDTATYFVTVLDTINNWTGKGAPPVTLDGIKRLLKTPNFYNIDYRPSFSDGLGSRYDKTSGGFFDTFKGETQLQIAIPDSQFKVKDQLYTLSTDIYQSKQFWLVNILGQEYFDIEMQYSLSRAMCHSLSGLTIDSTQKKNGYWQTLDTFIVYCANTYPDLFPEFQSQLTELSGNDVKPLKDDFIDYYLGEKEFNLNSPHVINEFILDYTNNVRYYDLLQNSSSLFFEDALNTANYSSLSISAMNFLTFERYGWILTVRSIDSIALRFSATEWMNTSQDESCFDTLFYGYEFGKDALYNAKLFVDASKQSLSDPSIGILDEYLSMYDLRILFWGEWGVAKTPGKGGLHQHFNLSLEERLEVDYLLEQAFDLLKGQSPSTKDSGQHSPGISLRYDFLTVLRTVKHYFQYKRPEPKGFSIPPIIEKYSE